MSLVEAAEVSLPLSRDGLERLLGARNLGLLLGAPLAREGLVADSADDGEDRLVGRPPPARLRVPGRARRGKQAAEPRDGRRGDAGDPKYVHLIFLFYRVTMVVSNYILLALFLKFHRVAQLLCIFCPICSCSRRIRQAVEHPNCSQQTQVADHHGHHIVYSLVLAC